MTLQSDPSGIRHFQHFSAEEHERLFVHTPEQIRDDSERDVVAMALGATLYVPANRPRLSETISNRAAEGVCSMVIDLEDAIADDEVETGIAATVTALDEIAASTASRALLFVRVREPEHIHQIAEQLDGGLWALHGFVVPKFSATTGAKFLEATASVSTGSGRRLFTMPVMETPEITYRETRDSALAAIRELLNEHREQILAVRTGATDMCANFGIRRDRDLTIYDVRVVADAIAAIVNVLGRVDNGFVITGPVWEYFADHERMFRPVLRATPFAEHGEVRFRNHLVSRDLDGLLREISLDRANGIHGKTVIHPSHVSVVHALSTVTHEEYSDANDILSSDAGGVLSSGYRNKMNERRPHRSWAQQTIRRARAFGVSRPGITFVDLLAAAGTVER